jgi:hypothetical protein
MIETEPKRVYLGTFDAATNVIIVPKSVLQPAEQALDREREKRERLASQVKMQALSQAKARGKLKRILTSLGFRRGRRGR